MEFSADLIDHRVWLGNIAAMENASAIDAFHITHILSVVDLDLPISADAPFTHKHIHVEDNETTDLLVEFDACYDFIDKALSENSDNNVLIHCQAGVSRSATIACMYLMRRYRLSADIALQRLRLARPAVHPNISFSAQLYLFEQMNNQLDVNHGLYKEFQFERACAIYLDHDTESEGVDAKNNLRQQLRKAFTLPYGHASCTVTESYVCRRCQTELFTNADLFRHSEGRGLYNWFKKYGQDRMTESSSEVECRQELFTHSLEWLMNQIDTPENNHNNSTKCPQCSAIVGKYDLNGKKCSCGRWVAPAFHFDADQIERKAATILNIETKTMAEPS